MAKFYGKVGFAHTIESKPGIWTKQIVEHSYYGDATRIARRQLESEKVNADIVANNSIRIVADAYAEENFFAIAYVAWAGTLWTVSSVTVERPRLVLEIGGVYNGPRAESAAPESGTD